MKKVDNYSRFYALIKNVAYHGDKEELKKTLVSQYTGGRTESLREMSVKEYNAMCDALQSNDSSLRKARSICLKLMQKMGVDTTNWYRINEFCKDPRIAGKVFSEISFGELQALAVKLRSIIAKDKKAAAPKAPERATKSKGGGSCVKLLIVNKNTMPC